MSETFRAVPNGTIRLTAVTIAGSAPLLAGLTVGGSCTVLIQNRGSVPVLVEFGAKADMPLPVAPSGASGGARSIPAGSATLARLQNNERHVAIAVAAGTPDIEFTVGTGDGDAFGIGAIVSSGGGGGGAAGTMGTPGYSYVVSDTSGTQPIGAPADAAATSDGGAFSLIALVKRGLGNWTTLLTRIPALVSGRVPVDGSGVTQPVSAASLPLPAGAATAAKQPALGTAGSPSTDVLTVQGSATGTALPVSQPKIAAGPTTVRTAVATGTTATVILAAGRTDEMVSLKNTGTVKAYIGGTGVSAGNGWPLAVGESMTMDAKMAEGGISAILDTSQATAGEIAVWRF